MLEEIQLVRLSTLELESAFHKIMHKVEMMYKKNQQINQSLLDDHELYHLFCHEIARKHCGHSSSWKIRLKNLKEKTDSSSTLNKFRYFIKEIEKTNHIPDYNIVFADNDIVIFHKRNKPQQLSLEALQGLRTETILKGKGIVEQSNTGWDYNEIRQQFTIELQKGFSPTKIDGAFINFVKKKVEKAP